MSSLDRSARAALIVVVVGIAAGAAAGCADRGGPAKPTNPPPNATDATATDVTDATQGTGATMPEVTITTAGERPGRPPLIRLLVNVTASNTGTAPRWVLIQSKLPDATGGVDKLEQLTAPGGVRIGRFLGTGGFYGVALAPGAVLTIKNLEIGWWNDGDDRTPPPIEVRTGTGVTVGGTDITGWFDADPAVTGTVEVDFAKAEHSYSKRSDGDREVPVQVAGGQSTKITVAAP